MHDPAINLISIIHYKVLFSPILQDVIMLVSTAKTVTHLVPPIVRTACVTYKVEFVRRVKFGGLECLVKQVR